MNSLRKLLKTGSLFVCLNFPTLVFGEDSHSNSFASQTLYEKMYSADFNGALVKALMTKCSGDLLDFSMFTSFPEIGYFSRKHLMGRGVLNNIVNLTTGGLLGTDGVWGEQVCDDDIECEQNLKPYLAGKVLADSLYNQSVDEGIENFLCDILFWDYVDEFAFTSERLVQETIFEIDKLEVPKLTMSYKADVLKDVSKVERLASARPGRVSKWQMNYSISTIGEFQQRIFKQYISESFTNTDENSYSDDEISKKDTILEVQSNLKRLGCNVGKVDGIVGPKSLRALQKFSDIILIDYNEKNFIDRQFATALGMLTDFNCNGPL